MIIPLVDYHIHTPLCGHAKGDPEEYVKRAMALGLREIGFSDHAPLVSHDDPSITMSMDQLPDYHRMVEDLQKRFPDFTIRLGIEADFIKGFEAQTKAILEGYPYDYVIGSVHYLDRWAFDNPDERQKWDDKDVDEVYCGYFDLLRRSAQSGLFDIIGHVDLVKKFGHRPTKNLDEEIKKTARVFEETGMVIEINTAGLRKPVKEIYPSLNDLSSYCEAGVPITFGSDSHDPSQVAQDFDKAARLAKEAGYADYLLFERRRTKRAVL
ncbi:MAG: histidinol-phosphatase HisJ family protein [Candidatus Omnitrophota bacterium]